MSSEVAEKPELCVSKVEEMSNDAEFCNNSSVINTTQPNDSSETSRGCVLMPFTCDVCDVMAEAKYLCTDCAHNICYHCYAYHEKYTTGHHVQIITALCQLATSDQEDTLQAKVKRQASVMEAMLSQLADEKQLLEHQMWAVEDDIDRRFTSGQKLLADVRDECLASLRRAVQVIQDRLQNETRATRLKHRELSQLLSKWDNNTGMSAAEKNTEKFLLSNEDLKSYQDRLKNGRSVSYFAYKIKEGSVRFLSLLNHIRDFMGSVESTGVTEGHCFTADSIGGTNISDSSLQPLVLDPALPELGQAPNRDINARLDGMFVMLTQLEERVVALGTETVLLSRELKDFKSKNSQVQSHVTDLSENLETSKGDENASYMSDTEGICLAAEKKNDQLETGLTTSSKEQNVSGHSSPLPQQCHDNTEDLQDVQRESVVQQEVSTSQSGSETRSRFSAKVRSAKRHFDNVTQDSDPKSQDRKKSDAAKRVRSSSKSQNVQGIQNQKMVKKNKDVLQKTSACDQPMSSPTKQMLKVSLVRINAQEKPHAMHACEELDRSAAEKRHQQQNTTTLSAESNEEQKEEISRRSTHQTWKGKNLTASEPSEEKISLPGMLDVKVRSVRVGSMRASATSVKFRQDALSFLITSEFTQETYSFEVLVEDITCIQFSLDQLQPLIFMKVTASCAEKLRKVLKMSDTSLENFNPHSYNLQKSFIVLIVENLMEEPQLRSLLQHYCSMHPFSRDFLRELSKDDANLLLVKSSPPVLSRRGI